jgi:hypothetical protein
MARIVNFVDFAESETVPTIGNIVASDLVTYANDAEFESGEAGAPKRGNIYFNTYNDYIRYYDGTNWQTLISVENLSDLLDVDVPAPVDGDLLQYDGEGELWVNSNDIPNRLDEAETDIINNTIAIGDVDTRIDELELTDLVDVDTSGVADGDALVYDSGTQTWVPGEAVGDTLPDQSGNAGKFLTTDGSVPSWANPGAGTPPLVTKYSSGSGTHTITGTPLYIRVRMVGGGGGGAGSGSTVSGGGGAGGATTFGTSLLTATGGGGGGAAVAVGAGGGAGGSGTINSPAIETMIYVGGGGGAYSAADTAGIGGSSMFGGGARALPSSAIQAGVSASANTGGGGSGATGNASTVFPGGGGGGGGGVDAIILSPSSSYSYAVGGGGAGGTPGTSGATGGAGGSGIIIVEEYYQ